MSANDASKFGYFTVFGFSKNSKFLEHVLPERLDVVPRTIDLGPAGRLFFYTSYGDMAETEEAIALKLGFVRTPALSPLSAQQLLDQGVVGPQGIDAHAVRGNGLVACFSKVDPRFSLFKTVCSGIPLYYFVRDDGILCSDQLRCLVDLLDRLELDEAAIPQHFLLLGTLGSQTYYRDVKRLRPGESLKWGAAGPTVCLIKDYRSLMADSTFGSVDARSPMIYQWLKDLVGAYIRDIQGSGSDFGNLLSGGVDSSLSQLLINEHLRDVRPKSYSYLLHAQSFEPEVEYAKQAQQAFNTAHTFVDILPQDYPDLVVRSTEILGQPVHMAIEPCKLGLVEFLANDPNSPHYYFNSQGAGDFFGMGVARKIQWLNLARAIPASALILGGAGRLLKPLTARSQRMLKAAMTLKDPNHLVAPINTTGISANFDFALRCFGEKAVQQVFEIRRGEETEYLDSHNYQEKVHLVDSFLTGNHLVSQTMAFFMAHKKELAYPFFDEDGIRISFAIRPEKRFIQGFNRVKPILKDILEQRSISPAPRLPKRGSNFGPDLYVWMDSGPLHEMVRSIERPSFLKKSDFENLLERPNYYFLWALLTFDVFSKMFLRS
jgi:asparagine synthetase B (glutamine-hydrolysing)